MRRIYENKDLSDQTLTGPGIQARFYNCDLTDTVFEGDWAGADYINCTCTRTDWTKADTYASYWHDCLPMEEARFPANIGYFHREPMYSLIRYGMDSAVSQLPRKERKEALLGLNAGLRAVEGEVNGSWGCGWQRSVEACKKAGASPLLVARTLWFVFENYRQGLHKMKELGKEIVGTGSVAGVRESVTLDFDEHPMLVEASEWRDLAAYSRFDRYGAARYLDTQGNALTSEPHHVFIEAFIPPGASVFPTTDFWYVNRKGGL